MIAVDQILTDVLRREGWPAVTDRAADKGGLTKGGVTLAAYNQYRVRLGMGPLNRVQFERLSEADARTFYASVFVQPFAFVDDDGIQALLIDWGVMTYIDDPTRALQAALATRGHYTGKIDGAPGPKTQVAWNAFAHAHHDDMPAFVDLERELLIARIKFHLAVGFDSAVDTFLTATPKTQLHNLRGWIVRAAEFI